MTLKIKIDQDNLEDLSVTKELTLVLCGLINTSCMWLSYERMCGYIKDAYCDRCNSVKDVCECLPQKDYDWDPYAD
jgi:hypothetical protein